MCGGAAQRVPSAHCLGTRTRETAACAAARVNLGLK